MNKLEIIELYGRKWEEIESYFPRDDEDYFLMRIEGVGEIWMNNCYGFVVLIEPNGRILKGDI